jgi:hypothetical protein
MAQLVLAAAGAAVGGLIGGPQGAQLGWALGSMLGSAMGPTQKSEGPRLSDLKVAGTEYGQPIAFIEGHPIIAGQIWWASDRREIATTTEVGKGGPSAENTTYTYEVDLLVGLTDHMIGGVSRIFLNGKLVYTSLIAASPESITASDAGETWRRMTVYTGGPSQLPDPTYEAAKGVGNVPAYRGRGTIFIEGLQLGSSGQIPNITVEVARNAVVSGVSHLVADSVSAYAPNSLAKPGSPAYSTQFPFDVHYYNPFGAGVQVFEVTPGSTSFELVASYAYPTTSTPGEGQSDVSGIVFSSPGSSLVPQRLYFMSGRSGGVATFSLSDATDTLGTSDVRYARRGDRICFGSAAQIGASPSGPLNVRGRIYSYSTSGGSLASYLLGQRVVQVAMGGGHVYYLCFDHLIYQFDVDTLTPQGTISIPDTPLGTNMAVVTDDNGTLYYASDAGPYVYRWTGTAWVVAASGLSGLVPTVQPGFAQFFGMSNGRWFGADTTRSAPGGYRLIIARLADQITPQDEPLADVVSRQCIRAGMDASMFDVSALSSMTRKVRAMAVGQVTNVRSVLELLASAYYFEAVLSDKLYFRPRGAASVATISYADLGASDSPDGVSDALVLRPLNEVEIPAQVAVSYLNIDADCQRDTQYSDRLLTSVQTTTPVELALGLTAAEAKGIADAMVMDQIASAMTTSIAVLPDYARLEPTDPVTITGEDGSTYRMRLVKKTDAGLLSFDAVLDDASVLIEAGLTSSDYVPATTVALPAETVLELLDIPILRDADDAPGFYAAAKGTAAVWPGASVQRSNDDIDYSQVATITESAVIGMATTVLPSFAGGNVFDVGSSLTVDVGAGQLSSATRDALFADTTLNALLVGSEVVRFLNATLVSTGVYTLSGFLRGQRGTEHAIGGHVASERVVLLRTRGLRRIDDQSSDLGVSRFYKGVSLGRRVSTADSQEFADAGVGMKPFAPVDARGTRDTDGNMVLTWRRRTRLAARFVGPAGINVPLGESTEAYDVEVYSGGTFTTLLRTLSSSTGSVNYTPDMVSADFGGVQSTLYVRIYQRSSVVGRGYPLQAAVSFGAALPAPVVVFTGSGATKNVVSNIDVRTGGSLLLKMLAAVGEPNSHLFNIGSLTVDLNTSSSSPPVTSAGNYLGALGLTLGASSVFNNAGLKTAAVFLPKRAGVFERVSWTGNGAGNRSMSHALGVAPALALLKRRDNTDSWLMYSSVAGANKSLTFPSASGAAFVTDTASFPNASDSTNFKVGAALNVSGALYEALLFPETSAFADAGTYVGNGSSSGPSVTLPYQPRLLLIRSMGASNRFTFITSDRLAGSGATHWFLDDQGAAAASSALLSLSATGFAITSADTAVNEAGVTYQYIALQPWS